MKKEKYYYSKPAKRGCVDVILDSQNNILEISKQFWCVQSIPRVTICGIYDNEQHKVVEIHPEDKISELFITNARLIEEEVLEHWSKEK